jgi:hypothetical protein
MGELEQAEMRLREYRLSKLDADELKGASLVDVEIRSILFQKYLAAHGPDALINMFAQFVGLANSVVANNREFIEIFAITDCGIHPHNAHEVNLPTIFGALCGIELANSVNQKKTCGGCAYRLASCANQSPVTTCDADWADKDDHEFLCHEKVDDNGNPTTLCLGHAQRKKLSRPSPRGGE